MTKKGKVLVAIVITVAVVFAGLCGWGIGSALVDRPPSREFTRLHT